MRQAVIVDGVRTPFGRAHPEKGWLRNVRADDLGVLVVRELLRRTGVAPGEIEEVILGCANQTGEQAMNVARYVSLMAGLSPSVAAQTINRQCASSMTALHVAAQAIMAGQGDVFIAGGVESMTHLPEGAGAHLHPRRFEHADPSASSMGRTAENLASIYDVSRGEQEEWALGSHQKAVAAQRDGRSAAEMAPVPVTEDGVERLVEQDQCPRADTSLDVMAAFPALLGEGGTLTLATTCPPADGAAALLVVEREKAGALGLRPRAVVKAMAAVGVEPHLMGLGAVAAARKALHRAGLTAADIDVWEVNEPFAVVPLVFLREMGVPAERVNPKGGAVALGHPMGATGARLIATLLPEMERRGARYGLATLCVGMGQGVATILETLS